MSCQYCKGTGWKYVGNGVTRCHCQTGQAAVQAAAERAKEPKRGGRKS